MKGDKSQPTAKVEKHVLPLLLPAGGISHLLLKSYLLKKRLIKYEPTLLQFFSSSFFFPNPRYFPQYLKQANKYFLGAASVVIMTNTAFAIFALRPVKQELHGFDDDGATCDSSQPYLWSFTT